MGEVLPASVRTAMGLPYGMFIAIVLPVARNSRPVLFGQSLPLLLLRHDILPYLNVIPYGWRTIICTVIAAALGATFAPPPQTPPQDTGQHST